MNLLFIGDIVGRPGRRALQQALPGMVERWQADFVIANGENAAAGFGITPAVAQEILTAGVDVITTGNHVWNKKEAEQLLAEEARVLRPANYPPAAPGRGAAVFATRSGVPVGVINLCGRVFMDCVDCPFREAERQLTELHEQARVLVVDMHGEATSEKLAMGWMLDGRASAVIGTHTHVATADAQVLPAGTAYITDVGMTGPRDSVLGIEPRLIIRRFNSKMPVRFKLAGGPVVVGAVVVDIDEESGRARSIRALQEVVAGSGAEPADE
jgi:hypothetical protein